MLHDKFDIAHHVCCKIKLKKAVLGFKVAVLQDEIDNTGSTTAIFLLNAELINQLSGQTKKVMRSTSVNSGRSYKAAISSGFKICKRWLVFIL